MKNEHKDLSPVELALLTWYKPDNPLYRNPEHPTIKLAGEIGELLDLYGKHKYKPNFDWMQCKHCGKYKPNHDKNNLCISGNFAKDIVNPTLFNPIVLDELGDIWYYLRILSWMRDLDFPSYHTSDLTNISVLEIIKIMYSHANYILQNGISITGIYYSLLEMLFRLNFTLDDLTLSNYYKLNSEETNHGWADAR